MTWKSYPAVLTFSLLAAVPGLSKPAPYYRSAQLTQQVLPGRPETFADLLGLLAPGLRQNQGGHLRRLKPLPGTPSDADNGTPSTPQAAPPPTVSVRDISTFWLQDGNRRLLVLLAELASPQEGFPPYVLALYQLNPGVVLLDAVDVSTGPHIGLAGELLPIRPGHPAFTLLNWHDNSSESFEQTTVVGLLDGHFRALLQLPTAYGFTNFFPPDDVCRRASSFKLAVSPGHNQGYQNLTIRYQHKAVCHPSSAPFDWNSGIVDSLTLEKTAIWNPHSQAYQAPASQFTVTGVVYSDLPEGGAGDSQIRFWADGHLFRFTHQGNPPKSKPWQTGQLWRIRYQKGWSGDEILESSYLGQADPELQSAVGLLKSHYRKLKAGKYEAAYSELSGAWQQQQSLPDFIRLNSESEPTLVEEWSQGFKVLDHTHGRVRLLALASDLSRSDSPPGSLRFTLIKQGRSWVIDRVEAAPLADWVRS